MICFKLFQFPANSSKAYESMEKALRDRIIYKKDGFVVVSLETGSICSICNIIKGIKIRTIILSKYVLGKAQKNFSAYGYEVTEKYDDDGDVIQLQLRKDDEDVEINTDGYIYMRQFKNGIIDTLVSIFQGVD